MRVLLTWEATERELRLITSEWPFYVDCQLAGSMSSAEVPAMVREVDVVVGFMHTVRESSLEQMRRLQLVHLLGHGTDGLLTGDVCALLRERGVRVACAKSAAVPIAEWVVMAMTALTRRVFRLHQALVQSGDWSPDLQRRSGQGVIGGELEGATVGIVGYGAIGSEIHRRCRAFGMSVGALSRRPERVSGAGLDFVRAWSELKAFLSECDYVVLAVPLADSTRALIGAGELAAMRPGAVLINVGRGAIVDEDALWHSLRSGRLGGAALDVFENEEERGLAGYPADRPLHQFNTLMTPHCAGATTETRARSLRLVGENLRRLRELEPLLNETDLPPALAPKGEPVDGPHPWPDRDA